MAHFPHSSGTKGKCPVCPMIRRRYLAGIFVKEQVQEFLALSAERGAQIVTILNLENQDSLHKF